MHFQLQAKGAVELAGFASICQQDKWIKQQEANSFSFANSFYYNNEQEPTSVLHMRRSQSPPTSASTLSSSFNGGAAGAGGGGNSTDNTTTTAATIAPPETSLPNNNKEEWATELQPIPSELDLVPGPGGGQRCNLGLEDWETMLSESAVSPSQDHSFLGWITGDVNDPSFGLKQLLQSGSTGPNPGLDFEGNAGLGVVDQGPGFDPIGSLNSSGPGNVISSAAPNLGGFPGSGFLPNTSNNGNGKIGSVMPSSSSVGVVNNHKVLGASVGLNTNIQNPVFTSPANNIGLPVSLPMLYQQQQQGQYVESQEEKPQILNAQVLMVQQQHPQNPNFFLPLPQEHHLLQPLPKRLNPGNLELSSQIPKLQFSDAGHELFMRKQQQQHMGFPHGVQFVPQQKPLMVAKQKVLGPGEEMAQQQQQHQYQLHQQQQTTLFDLLYQAAELVGTGNFLHAQGILARLNHQLSPVGKPLQRAAFYFKEALQLLLIMNNPVSPPPLRSPTPFDVIFKMGAYKVFSEVSPLIQFVNFTCNQALLEALDDADRIHIVDFDIGFGAQWASFMQELPMRSRGAPSLRITAFASPSTHHPIELGLMRENLMQFANEIGVNFELEVLNFDCLDQTPYSLPMFRSNENEAVAVNFPVWSSSNQPSALPNLLRFVKQLSPKIMVSLDRGGDRNDLPFPQHIIHAFQSYINLFESLDAVNVTSDAVNKIEKFLFVPRIESTVLGRLHAPEKMPLWRTLFSSAGFSPVTFSNFTETQAECVVKRAQVRGFRVEKRQASLVLCWLQGDLISVSAWRC
ncbi:GRAS family transcription factor [Theobroma cacao]|uniref:GRAS family transcription factor n=1 Tax=Theobroma cacao TaxID=3641 RepID=A0A061GBD8_THECC|nr:GRAS family transcription factor [Theobroma cacao]